jgi:hypothetical protein
MRSHMDCQMQFHENNLIVSTRLDRRYNGYEHFKWQLRVKSRDFTNIGQGLTRLQDYVTLRNYCADQFGHSCELFFYTALTRDGLANPHWCWETENNKMQIFVNDFELVQLGMVFPVTK